METQCCRRVPIAIEYSALFVVFIRFVRLRWGWLLVDAVRILVRLLFSSVHDH